MNTQNQEQATLESTNVALVKQAYAALGKGDIPTFMSLLADDVVWDMPHPREIVPFGGKWHGHEELKKFLEAMHDYTQMKQVKLDEFIAQNDKVVVIGYVKVLAKPLNREYENELVAVWTIENGKIKQMKDFMDTVQAVSAFQGD